MLVEMKIKDDSGVYMREENQDLAHSGKAYWNASITLSAAAQAYHSPERITSPYGCNPLDITLFVSCYNEEKFIVDTLATIVEAMKKLDKTYEIIIIDDCSKDHSVELVQNYIALHPEVAITLRANSKNKGLAQNYIDAAFIGRGKYYRFLCGDNSEPVETIVTVLSQIGEADIIIPYYTEFQDRVFYRQFLSKSYTWLINWISGNAIEYYNGLHIHLRYNVMRWHPNTRGFGFQASLLCSLISLGFTYKEVACITVERRGGRGNAVTWKNLRSVVHTMGSLFIRRLAPWV